MQRESIQNQSIVTNNNRFLKPVLNDEQISKLKILNSKDNFHGFIAIIIDIAWILSAIYLSYFSMTPIPLFVALFYTKVFSNLRQVNLEYPFIHNK